VATSAGIASQFRDFEGGSEPADQEKCRFYRPWDTWRYVGVRPCWVRSTAGSQVTIAACATAQISRAMPDLPGLAVSMPQTG
jgi:hypothetical protein